MAKGGAAKKRSEECAEEPATAAAAKPVRTLAPVFGGASVPTSAIEWAESRDMARVRIDRLNVAARTALEDDVTPAELRALEIIRPKKYGDCIREGWGRDVGCPFVGCRHHLSIEVAGKKALRIFYPEQELDRRVHTCSLRAAELAYRRGGMSADEIGKVFSIKAQGVMLMVKGFLGTARARARQGGHLRDWDVGADEPTEAPAVDDEGEEDE